MKKFRNIEIGSNVSVYNSAGAKRIEGSERPDGSFLSAKMYFDKSYRSGIVTKIHGHNANACRITFDNGQEVEVGLSTHYHLDGATCDRHQSNYSLI